MSAVIYAAIVVMWAVVLVPMWLRRHDAATEARSVDRFSTAMRTLSRRTTAAPGRRYVVMPRRSDGGPSVHVSGASAADARRPRGRVTARVAAPAAEPDSSTAAAHPARPAHPGHPARPAPTAAARRPAARRSLIARRRRLLLGMLGLTLLTFVLAIVGVISWPLQAVVDVVLVAFCIHLRAQAKRAVAVSRQRRRVTVATPHPAARPTARPAPTRRPEPSVAAAETVAERLTERFAERFAEPLPVQDEPVAATGTGDAFAADPNTSDADTWDPVPVPRPTYTMKPPAPAPAYEVDPLRDTEPHGIAMPPVEGYEAVAADELYDQDADLDDILERRWAVND